MSARKSDHDTLWDLIKDIKFGMLTHRHGDGSLQGHPLTTQN
ncbi:MAG: general stress protein, partial [Polaromonas sp.]|nr:general stress protein [Polaromonas sp.]